VSEEANLADDAAELRRRAEEINRRSAVREPENLGRMPPEEVRRMLHELQVHQIELEMQNEELRRRQAELDAERAAYFDLYDVAPVGYCTVNEAGLILKANLTAAGLLGVARSALVRQRLTSFIFPADEDRYYLCRKRLFETGEPQECELRMVDRDGAAFWVRLQATTALDQAGQRVGRVVVIDITERKRAEEALQASEERYRSIVSASPDAIAITDLEGRILMVSPTALRMSGCEREDQLLGSAVTDFIVPEDRDRAASNLALRLHGVMPGPGEYLGLRHDGSTFFIEVNGEFIRDTGGKPRSLVFVVRDITGRRQAEAEKAKLEARFQQAQKMETVGRLAGGVAHDFNNLLTVINGYSQMLLADLKADDPRRGDLAEIHNAGKRAAGLTSQLLAYSRQQLLEPRSLDLNSSVEEMLPLLSRLLGTGVEVRVALNAEHGTVCADPHQLTQVIMNLAVNARDAMPGGGQLLIETSAVEREERHLQPHPEARAGRYVMLAVTDTGIGMNEETRQRIFEPFFTTKPVGHGTGLGLAMVHGMLAQSGGYIEVYSEPGHGSTFKMYLPMVETAPVDSAKPEAVPTLVGKETVLVVEDRTAVRKYAATALRAYGYRVIQAKNGSEALLFYEREQEHIDLVLTDVVMPNLSGTELAIQLRERWPGTKVLFMSGFSDNIIEHWEALGKGADFIQKPFSPEELAVKVRAVLKGAPQK
jgi:two-component system cell cycle sensor histidine kinase/response regulator CckA